MVEISKWTEYLPLVFSVDANVLVLSCYEDDIN